MQLWSFGRVRLGLDAEEFWRLTPLQFDALMKQHERQTWDAEYLFAQLTAVVKNHSFHAPKESTSIGAFMPSEQRRKKQKPKRRTRQQIADEFRAVMAPYVR